MRFIRKFAPLTMELETEREVKRFVLVLDAIAASEDIEAYLKERGLSAFAISAVADWLEELRSKI